MINVFTDAENIDFGGNVGNFEIKDAAVLLVKYNAKGDAEWVQKVMFAGYTFNYEAKRSSILRTKDDGYVVSGFFDDGITTAGHKKNQDGFLAKYNSDGHEQWFYTFGGVGEDIVNSVIEMSDGSFRVIGKFDSMGIDFQNGVVLDNKGKYDGMLMNFKETDVASMYVKKMTSTNLEITSSSSCIDGGYIVGGDFYRNDINFGDDNILENQNVGYNDGAVVKFNSLGDVEWGKSFGGKNSDYVTSVVQCTDGGYIVTGTFESSEISIDNKIVFKNMDTTNSNTKDCVVIKYTADGSVEWARSIGGNKNDEIVSAAETNDNGYIIVGDFESNSITVNKKMKLFNAGNTNGMIIKYDYQGNAEWVQSLNGPENVYITSVVATDDGGYVLTGYFTDCLELEASDVLKSVSGADGFIIKYNKEGESSK